MEQGGKGKVKQRIERGVEQKGKGKVEEEEEEEEE
jgi:hypothetical protein